jgi:NTP pyrophosphatase (non-canonical NTP hydrolase)
MKNTKHEIAKEIADNIIGSLEYQCGAQEGALLALEKIEEQPRKVDLLTIMTKFGAFHQLKKLSEEVYEFQEATLRFLHKGVQKAAITEEMADVLVVLSQFRELFGITDDELRKIMCEKVDRTLARQQWRTTEKPVTQQA